MMKLGERLPSALSSLILAVAILAIAGLLARSGWVGGPPASPTPVASLQEWPDAPPTFTPTAPPIPKGTPSPTPTHTPTPTPTLLPPPTWSELGHLTSVVYTGTTVVELEREKEGLGMVLGSDRVLMMVVGRIQVGIDLTRVDDSDVAVDGTSLRVRLPRAAVDGVELLPERSRIFESGQSWLFSEYEGLEVEALGQARADLRRWAEANQGMLELAEELGKLQLADFLRTVGYESVEITFGGIP